MSLFVIAAMTLVGCRVGPVYEPPELPVPQSFTGVTGDPRATSRPSDLSQWWTRFNDERLTRLVERAIIASPDVEEAVARVMEARALRAAENGARLPQIEGNAFYSRDRISENLDGFPAGGGGGGGGGGAGGGFAFQPETDLWQIDGGLSWEIDLFGRLSRRVEAADRTLEAELFDLVDVRVTLAAEVAVAYVDTLELSNRLDIAQQNVDLQQRSLDLAQARFEAGLTTELDVAQAVANLQQTKATVPALRASAQAARNRLSRLSGEVPGYAEFVIDDSAALPVPDDDLAVGVPADLLRRRPDIRRAERELASAVASVGAAEGDLYPRLSLVGTFGFAAGDIDNVFNWDSRTFGVGPAINWPIFQGGTLRALVGAADARVNEARAEHRRTLLLALSEVADALTNLAQDRERELTLTDSVTAARRAVELAEAQYTDGLVEFDRVLDAQSLLFSAEDALATAEANVVRDYMILYRTLGGGWRPQERVDDTP
ncbi:MAG: efflux transporter outer membrane subunit [Planctomycetota bacterium]